jgi:hypothetical protein
MESGDERDASMNDLSFRSQAPGIVGIADKS